MDFEGELAVVIGRRARNVSRTAWKDVVLGFTVALDVSARDWQKSDGQWWRAKGSDTFCPLGPAIETDADPANLLLETLVDGVVKQSARTSDMVFDVGTLIEWITAVVTLEPGDVILTGITPEAAGASPRPGRRWRSDRAGRGSLSITRMPAHRQKEFRNEGDDMSKKPFGEPIAALALPPDRVSRAVRDAAAVDRPGAPINVISFPDMTPGKLPAIALGFRNTAKEEVTFWVEWTVNGQLKGDPQTTLPRTRMERRRNVSCTGLLGTTTKSDDPGKSQGHHLRHHAACLWRYDRRVGQGASSRINDVDWDDGVLLPRSRPQGGRWNRFRGLVAVGMRTNAGGPASSGGLSAAGFVSRFRDLGAAGHALDGILPNRIRRMAEYGGAAHYEVAGPWKP